MNIVGIIAVMFALGSAVGYHNTKRRPIKYYLLELAFLFTAITASWLYMVKCYEVPIHNNRISYVLKHFPSSFVHYSGHTSIDIVYDYNTYKGIKELTKWGAPKDTEPRIVVDNFIKVDSGKSSVKQSHGYYAYESEWLKEEREMILNDPMYLSYMDSCGLDPGSKDWLEGTFSIIAIMGSNRQYFYPFIFSPTVDRNTSWRREFAYYEPVAPDSVKERPDSIWREFQWERVFTIKRSANNFGARSYSYIPLSDSIFINNVTLRRSDFHRPNAFFTAEDISRAVEVLWIDGLRRNGSEINIRSLTFDYIGPTEFSGMYPEPDRIEVSKISFTDSTKLRHIAENGLRFHVKFPDMENVQQIRMFIVTLILGGLLGLLVRLFRKMTISYRTDILNFLKQFCHLNRKRVLWICTIILILIVVLLFLVAMNSYVDAFDLSETDSWWVF